MFDIQIVLNLKEDDIMMPRAGDKWIMLEFERIGLGGDLLERLNRVRIYMQVLFLSDVLGANGKNLDKQYLTKRNLKEKWSRENFPNERPPRRDFLLWERTIRQLVPSTGINDRLGPLTTSGHKLWPWRYDMERRTLTHIKGRVMDVYKPSQLPRYQNVRNRYTRLHSDQPTENSGVICTVRTVAPAVVAVVSTTSDPPPKEVHECFMDVLEEWGYLWMWDSISWKGL